MVYEINSRHSIPDKKAVTCPVRPTMANVRTPTDNEFTPRQCKVSRFTSTPSIHFHGNVFFFGEISCFNSNMNFTLGEVHERDSVRYWILLSLCNDNVSNAEIIQSWMRWGNRTNCKGNALERCFLWHGNNSDSVSLYKRSLIRESSSLKPRILPYTPFQLPATESRNSITRWTRYQEMAYTQLIHAVWNWYRRTTATHNW